MFTELIFGLAVRFRFSVTSWFRTPARNEMVGGVPESLHLVGMAVDVILDDGAQGADFKRAAERLGLQVLDEGDHLHVQMRRSP